MLRCSGVSTVTSTVWRTLPVMDRTTLAALAAELFDVNAEAAPLPGERNRNARLDVEGQPQYLLKVYAAETSAAEIALQEALMDHLARAGSAVPTAALVAANSATVDGKKRTVHLLRWIP